MKNFKINDDVCKVIAVLAAALLGAALLTLVMIFYYGPSGHYLAGNTMLSPEMINEINESEEFHKKGSTGRFSFDNTEYSFYDPAQKKSVHRNVSPKAYQKFYQSVASNKSLEKVTPEIEKLFIQTYPITLSTQMKSHSRHEKDQKQQFQVMQFTKEGYFRVMLHGELIEGEWAYFYQSDLYKTIDTLFNQE